jgi:alpha-tubulin suppressor-like RCC1 family protein
MSLSNGLTHSLAVKTNGKLFAWGFGDCGQLGVPTQYLSAIQSKYLGKPSNIQSEEIKFDNDEDTPQTKDIFDPHKWVATCPLPLHIDKGLPAKIQFK